LLFAAAAPDPTAGAPVFFLRTTQSRGGTGTDVRTQTRNKDEREQERSTYSQRGGHVELVHLEIVRKKDS
jgi:hypothetical protein